MRTVKVIGGTLVANCGKYYRVGATVEVTELEALYLKSVGMIEMVEPEPVPEPEPESAPEVESEVEHEPVPEFKPKRGKRRKKRNV